MIDNEIIKALECCSINGCKNCKYKGKAPDCMTALQKDTIDLINRQKAEIEKLHNSVLANAEVVKTLINELKTKKPASLKEFVDRKG